MDELLDSGNKLRQLLHQCSELFLHRHSKTLRESNQHRYHVSEMFCVRCELEPNTCDKISDKREQLPEQQSIENEARTGTHDHVRPEPLHSVPLWSLTTACVSSPDEMGHLFQVA